MAHSIRNEANCVTTAMMSVPIHSAAETFDCRSLEFVPVRIEVTGYSSTGPVIRKKPLEVSGGFSVVCSTNGVSASCKVKKSNRR